MCRQVDINLLIIRLLYRLQQSTGTVEFFYRVYVYSSRIVYTPVFLQNIIEFGQF